MEWQQEFSPHSTTIKIILKPNEHIFINPHSFLSSKGNIKIETQDLTKIFKNLIDTLKNKSIKNLFDISNTQNLFLSKITSLEESEIYLSSIIPGDIKHIQITPDEEYIIFSDYYVGHYGEINLSTEIQYLKDSILLKALGITKSTIRSFLSNLSLRSILSIRNMLSNLLNLRNLPFLILDYILSEKNKAQNLKHLVCMKITGNGGVFIAGCGGIKEIEVESETKVNYFHLIGFRKNINYKLEEFTNFTMSEHSIIIKIQGPTKILLQTRNWNAITPIINEGIVTLNYQPEDKKKKSKDELKQNTKATT